MKRMSLILLLLGLSMFTACSSTPNIAGMWQVENWDCEFIEIDTKNIYYKFSDSGKKDNREFFERGNVRFFNQDGRDCLMLDNSYVHKEKDDFSYWFAYEIVNDGQIILFTDKEYKNDQCLDVSAEEDLVKIDLMRAE